MMQATQTDKIQLQKILGNILSQGKARSLKDKGVGHSEYQDDFTNFYKATDSITASGGTGGQAAFQSLQELRFLAEKRLGVGYNITHGFAEDALFNWFRPKKVDLKSHVTIPGFNKWVVESDFKNQSILWDAHKRIYGVGLLVKFWTNHDKLSTPPPKKPPRAFQVIAPTYLAPVNVHETRFIDYDEEVWEFMGGHLRVSQIHRDRIEVLRGEPQPDSWRGLSVLESNYLALVCYYNGMIYLTRALAKLGLSTPVIKASSITPTLEEYNGYLALMQAMQMNNFFILGRDDDLQYPPTNIAAGLGELIEILKEDISSGTRIPLNTLFGRSESGGVGGQGALTAERKYLNLLANEQTKISDDFIRIFNMSGFDFEGLELDWRLSLQKTTEQQLAEDNMELNNKILEQQLKMMKKENTMLKAQQELFDEHKDQFSAEQQMQTAEQIKEDFSLQKIRYEKFQQLQHLISMRSQGDRK